MGEAPLDLLALLDDLEVVPYTADCHGRITWVSPTVGKLFGYTPREIVGKEPELFVPSDALGRARDQLERKLSGSTQLTIYELTALAKDGSRVAVQIVSAPLLADGKIVGVRGLALRRRAPAPAQPVLTPRQFEVLHLLADGRATTAIAAELGISEETARNHIRAVLGALSARSRLEAVATARRAGLL
ncbi:MAG TPA: LuxR C-terminal-related transcriptional regulator [Gaiellaceae bacterium]|nr:LuxR C-terminal-related transcriptional regulator [Gaiellaceae bacterium]